MCQYKVYSMLHAREGVCSINNAEESKFTLLSGKVSKSSGTIEMDLLLCADKFTRQQLYQNIR